MSQYYLIDLFDTTATSVTPPTSGAPIISVASAPPSGQVLSNGAFVVRLPDIASLINPVTGEPTVPQNLGDLLAFKYQGLLSFFAGSTHITYDDLLDTSGINLSASNSAGTFGAKGSIALNPGATLTSNAISIATMPANGVLTWEVFQNLDTDPATGRFLRTYQERPSTSTYTSAQISFNNGSSFHSVSDQLAFNISPADQGSTVIVKITNNSPSKLGVGSWALIY